MIHIIKKPYLGEKETAQAIYICGKADSWLNKKQILKRGGRRLGFLRWNQWDYYEEFKYGTQMKRQISCSDNLSWVLAGGLQPMKFTQLLEGIVDPPDDFPKLNQLFFSMVLIVDSSSWPYEKFEPSSDFEIR